MRACSGKAKRILKWAALTVALATLAGWLLYIQAAGPVYNGKRMRTWVNQLYALNQPDVREAQNVFLELRGRGLPWLIRDLEKTAESGPSFWIEAVIAKLPRRWREMWSPQVELVHAKSRILDVLIKLGPEAAPAAPVVGKTLFSENMRLNSMAGEALGGMGPAAVPVIREVFTRTNHQASSIALYAVAQLRTNAAPLLPQILEVYHRDSRLRPRATMALSALSPHADELLGKLLLTNDLYVAIEAAHAVASSSVPSTNFVPALLKLSAHPDPKLRFNAHAALGNLSPVSREARKRVAEGLRDPSPMIQKHALRTLQMYPRDAAEQLSGIAAFLSNEDRSLQVAALQTLGAMGTNAIPVRAKVEKLRDHPHRQIAEPASLALRRIDGDQDQ
jgi:HEAT repeat protein